MQKKRKRDKADEGPSNSNLEEDSDMELKQKVSRFTFRISKNSYQIVQGNGAVTFKDKNALMAQLKRIFKTSEHIFFHACYDLPADPLMSDRDYVKATAHEIWRVTGYRFT